jgi:hypothetical protein
MAHGLVTLLLIVEDLLFINRFLAFLLMALEPSLLPPPGVGVIRCVRNERMGGSHGSGLFMILLYLNHFLFHLVEGAF